MTLRLPRATAAHRRQLLERVRSECENRPGVYRMIGETGIVLYVGKSRRLRTRLLSYFRARGRRNKAARILRHAFTVEWEYSPTEFSALLAELRLIKRYRPEFNAAYIGDEWPRAWIAITSGPVPALRVIPRSDDPHALALFGPFRRVAQVREAVRALAETMHIRDCALDNAPDSRQRSLWFATDSQLATVGGRSTRTRTPGCLRYDLGTCAAPCIGMGDGGSYRDAFTEIRRFLDGESRIPLERLERDMEAASQLMEFERAARLRDRLQLLRWLGTRVRQFRADADRLTFRYHAQTFDGGEQVYFIRRGTLRAELSTSCDESAIAELSARVYDGPDPGGADIPLHDLDEFYLVSSWFRRHPDELARTFSPRTAIPNSTQIKTRRARTAPGTP